MQQNCWNRIYSQWIKRNKWQHLSTSIHRLLVVLQIPQPLFKRIFLTCPSYLDVLPAHCSQHAQIFATSLLKSRNNGALADFGQKKGKLVTKSTHSRAIPKNEHWRSSGWSEIADSVVKNKMLAINFPTCHHLHPFPCTPLAWVVLPENIPTRMSQEVSNSLIVSWFVSPIQGTYPTHLL